MQLDTSHSGDDITFQQSELQAGDDDRALRRQIHSAFSDVELGGATSLDCLRNELDGQATETSSTFTRHWSEYAASELETCTDALSHLDAGAWRFYLPAFLLGALDRLSMPIWETALPGAVLFNLCHPVDGSSWAACASSRFQCLTARQADAIRAFLDFVRSHSNQERVHADDASKALRSFWDLPANSRHAGEPLARVREGARSGTFSRVIPARRSERSSFAAAQS